MKRLLTSLFVPAFLCLFVTNASAQNADFGNGWVLDGAASALQFQSIKNQSKIETSSFATMSGAIAPDGSANVKIQLDSVDTKIDLRNVRMRFLFFETFVHPEANITAKIDAAVLADLPTVRRKTIDLPFELNLHGVSKTLSAKLAITLIGDDLVAVSTAEPVNVSVADFDLEGGLVKLEEAAGVTIVPSSSVNFDFIFRAAAGSEVSIDVAQNSGQSGASTALEAEGDFSLEACVGRFEILSRTGNIYFKPGSARLDAASAPLLNTVADIVTRCPGLDIQIAGHTDSVGGEQANQRLSERRAASVVAFLSSKGISKDRMVSVGFGEAQPVASNDTNQGRSRNRRIEFSVSGS